MKSSCVFFVVVRVVVMQCLFTRHKHPSRPPSVKTEVALNRERLLLDLGLELDLGRTLRLALDPLRTRLTGTFRFARRAPAFHLPVRAGVAHSAAVFQLAVGAGGASRTVGFHLPVRAGVALHAAAFLLAVRAGGARHAVAFHPTVRAGVARCAVAFQLPVRAGFALLAAVFPPAVRASL